MTKSSQWFLYLLLWEVVARNYLCLNNCTFDEGRFQNDIFVLEEKCLLYQHLSS